MRALARTLAALDAQARDATARERRQDAGLSRAEAALWLGVSVGTVRRWEREDALPVMAARLYLILSGVAPWPAWRDFRIDGERLHHRDTPREYVTPDGIQRVRYCHAQVREARRILIKYGMHPEQAQIELPLGFRD